MDSRNSTGRPLASAAWLETHHRAKLSERKRFAEMLAQLRPTRVVDLGCGTGLWLGLLDSLLPPTCEFIGLDSDSGALTAASARAEGWRRKVHFEQCDLDADAASIPSADLTLLFNVVSYLEDPADLLATLAEGTQRGAVAIRQYDGDALRFGPMATEVRALIEASLDSSVSSSEQFRHYDMDRVFSLLHGPWFATRDIDFELFQRVAPFPQEFKDYCEASLQWTEDLLSEESASLLSEWRQLFLGDGRGYWFEVDLTAVLS